MRCRFPVSDLGLEDGAPGLNGNFVQALAIEGDSIGVETNGGLVFKPTYR